MLRYSVRDRQEFDIINIVEMDKGIFQMIVSKGVTVSYLFFFLIKTWIYMQRFENNATFQSTILYDAVLWTT